MSLEDKKEQDKFKYTIAYWLTQNFTVLNILYDFPSLTFITHDKRLHDDTKLTKIVNLYQYVYPEEYETALKYMNEFNIPPGIKNTETIITFMFSDIPYTVNYLYNKIHNLIYPKTASTISRESLAKALLTNESKLSKYHKHYQKYNFDKNLIPLIGEFIGAPIKNFRFWKIEIEDTPVELKEPNLTFGDIIVKLDNIVSFNNLLQNGLKFTYFFELKSNPNIKYILVGQMHTIKHFFIFNENHKQIQEFTEHNTEYEDILNPILEEINNYEILNSFF